MSKTSLGRSRGCALTVSAGCLLLASQANAGLARSGHDVRLAAEMTVFHDPVQPNLGGPCQDLYSLGLAYGYTVIPAVSLGGELGWTVAGNNDCYDAAGYLVNRKLVATAVWARVRPLAFKTEWMDEVRHSPVVDLGMNLLWTVGHTPHVARREGLTAKVWRAALGYEARFSRVVLDATIGMMKDIGRHRSYYPFVRIAGGVAL